MTTLSETQTRILSAAAQREDRAILPLPETLRGGAAAKVVNALIAKGLIEEVAADTRTGVCVWRETGDGTGVTLVATEAGLAALAPEIADTGGLNAAEAPTEDAVSTAAVAPETAPRARTPRVGTKQAALIGMLRAESGATIAEIAAATGWQAHTVRGAIAGALKVKLGLAVTSEKVEGRGRVYRLPAA